MGSGNHTLMFGSDYIELLGVLTPTEHNAPTREFLARRGEGIERIAFTALDAAAGAGEIRARGYAGLGPTDFERPETLPDRVGSSGPPPAIPCAPDAGRVHRILPRVRNHPAETQTKRSGGQNIENNPMQSSPIPPGGTAQTPARCSDTAVHPALRGSGTLTKTGYQRGGRVEAEGVTRHGRYSDAQEN